MQALIAYFSRAGENYFSGALRTVPVGSTELAARMLRDTDEKTYLIAEKTGYTDPNYFSYVFKRHFGVTPSKYRAGQRA